ncbi:hypothetical protein [Nocardiopsis coralliicola]
MSLRICSLIVDANQSVPADGEYHTLRFPYGDAESSDLWNMHAAAQPDGAESAYPDERSALIWPSAEGWGTVTAMIHWSDGSYREVRSQLVRDPLGLAGGPDTTCTEDHAATPGGQYTAKHHALFVHPDVPLALQVRHDGSSAATVEHAQFKLAIETDVERP